MRLVACLHQDGRCLRWMPWRQPKPSRLQQVFQVTSDSENFKWSGNLSISGHIGIYLKKPIETCQQFWCYDAKAGQAPVVFSMFQRLPSRFGGTERSARAAELASLLFGSPWRLRMRLLKIAPWQNWLTSVSHGQVVPSWPFFLRFGHCAQLDML